MQEKRSRPSRRKAKMAFYIHTLVFFLLMPIMIGVNFFNSEFPWSVFVLMGWGLVVFLHWFSVSTLKAEYKRKHEKNNQPTSD